MPTSCKSCTLPAPFSSYSSSNPSPDSTRLRSNPLIRDAFSVADSGLAIAPVQPAGMNFRDASGVALVDTVVMSYGARPPNCLAVGMAHGVRGAVIGSVFGGAMALSTAVQSGYRGGALVSHAGMGAARNALQFASWTALYGTSRCGLVRMRGRQDLLNPMVAGGFTGGFLTLISSPRNWRYNRATIATNAAASAMIAVMFEALNYM